MDVFKLTPQGGLSRLVQHIESLFDGGCNEVYISLISKEQAKTQAQNNTFHKLISMWVKSGECSYSFEGAKYLYKIKAEIISHYSYIMDGKIKKTKNFEDIPVHCVETATPEPGSWSDATKAQAITAIDMVIKDIHRSGYSSKEFDQMLEHFREWR